MGKLGAGEDVIYIEKYDKKYDKLVLDFLQQCLPESHRVLELDGHHRCYRDIENYFKAFWCMFDEGRVIGTVAVKELGDKKIELKSLYLLESYHGVGLGYRLLMQALDFAKQFGYEEMYLDSLSTSKKALDLYGKVGFVPTERYNQNQTADVFMVLKL